MKKVLILLLCILLSACSKNGDLSSWLDNVFEEKYEQCHANNYTDYIQYYLPSDIQEYDCDALSYSFGIGSNEFIMNINVSEIINSKYYSDNFLNEDGFFDETKLIYNHDGLYENINGESINYFFKVYKYDDCFVLHMCSREVNIYGRCFNESDVALLASKFYQMAIYSNVENDKIIAAYSSKDVVDYSKNPINLFETNLPLNGKIDDILIVDKEEVPDN